MVAAGASKRPKGRKPGCGHLFSFFLQDDPRHSFTELVDVNKATAECLSLCRAVAEGGKGDELERKLLVLSELMHKVHQEMAQNLNGKKTDSVMFIVSVSVISPKTYIHVFSSNKSRTVFTWNLKIHIQQKEIIWG